MNKISISIILIFLLSCAEKHESSIPERDKIVISVNNYSQYDFSNFIESKFDLIPLETNDSCLITRVDKVIFTNNKYYILDRLGKSIFIFNDQGKYQKKLFKVGNAPGEYSRIDNFLIQNRKIWIIDGLKNQLLCYDEDFNLKTIKKSFDFLFADFVLFDDSTIYLSSNWNVTSSQTYHLQRFNMSNNTLLRDMPFEPISEKMHKMLMRSQFAKANDSILFTHSYSNTIYLIDSTGAHNFIDFSFTSRFKNTPIPIKEKYDPDLIYGLETIDQTPKHLLFSFMDGKSRIYNVYDKTTKTSISSDKLVLSTFGNFILNPAFFQDSIVLRPMEPAVLIPYFEHLSKSSEFVSNCNTRIHEIVNSIDEYSNPVIFKFKFKN